MLVTNYTPEEIFDFDSPAVYCRWVAAWNPVLFSYTRQDVLVASIADSSGNARINFTVAPAVRPVADDKVYVYVEDRFDGVYTVLSSPTADSIVIDTPSAGSFTLTGYVNLLTTRPNYYITLKISDILDVEVATIKYTPKTNGLIECDIQGILQSKLNNDNDYNITSNVLTANQVNNNAMFEFKVATKEFWTGSANSEVANGNDWYAVNGAFQIGHVYNGNYRDFFISNDTTPGKFLSPFQIPTVYPNFPYHLSFLWDTNYLTGNVNIATFTNYTSNIDELPPNTKSTGLVALTVPPQSEFNTFLFSLGGITSVDNRRKVWVWLQKAIGNVRITEQRMVKVKPVDLQLCNSVFLRWLAPDGSYGFYLFEGNYRESLQVESNGTYVQAFNRIDNLKGFSRYLKKTGFKKRQVGMSGLDKNDADGIETMLYSPMVYMVTPNDVTGFYDEVQVLIEPGTFSIKQSKQNFFDIEFSFVFPEIFNQGA
jgi:hypothetical protein